MTSKSGIRSMTAMTCQTWKTPKSFLPDGETIPLSDIATLHWHRGWSRIARMNGRQIVNVLGSIDTKRTNTMAVLTSLRSEKLPEIERRYPGIAIAYKGEAEREPKRVRRCCGLRHDRLSGCVCHSVLSVSQLHRTDHCDGRDSLCAGGCRLGALFVRQELVSCPASWDTPRWRGSWSTIRSC